GGFRECLKRKASTPLEVGRFIRTTGVCMNCGTVQHLSLSDRMVICPSCHSVFDRDVVAANKIKQEGLCLGNLGETLAEDYASTSSMLEYIKSIPHVKASIAYEARSSKQAVWQKPHLQGRGSSLQVYKAKDEDPIYIFQLFRTGLKIFRLQVCCQVERS
ncbi:MAG: zinc ribbon domain-containing protein, partial [Nitrososphaerota archaeon]